MFVLIGLIFSQSRFISCLLILELLRLGCHAMVQYKKHSACCLTTISITDTVILFPCYSQRRISTLTNSLIAHTPCTCLSRCGHVLCVNPRSLLMPDNEIICWYPSLLSAYFNQRSNIPYCCFLSQFFIDYNLYGMNYINVSASLNRRPVENEPQEGKKMQWYFILMCSCQMVS